MMMGRIDGRRVYRILVDGGATLNLMPPKYFKKLEKKEEEIVPTSVT